MEVSMRRAVWTYDVYINQQILRRNILIFMTRTHEYVGQNMMG